MAEFIIYFSGKVKKILPFGAVCIIEKLMDFFGRQMPPLAFFQRAQLEITDRFTHKMGDSVADFLKSSPDNPVFPFPERKTQPAAPVVKFFHSEIFRFEKIIVNFNALAELLQLFPG